MEELQVLSCFTPREYCSKATKSFSASVLTTAFSKKKVQWHHCCSWGWGSIPLISIEATSDSVSLKQTTMASKPLFCKKPCHVWSAFCVLTKASPHNLFGHHTRNSCNLLVTYGRMDTDWSMGSGYYSGSSSSAGHLTSLKAALLSCLFTTVI